MKTDGGNIKDFRKARDCQKKNVMFQCPLELKEAEKGKNYMEQSGVYAQREGEYKEYMRRVWFKGLKEESMGKRLEMKKGEQSTSEI